MKIIKRDGRKVDFNSSKIDNAIVAAAIANNVKLTKLQIKKITNLVIQKIIKSKLKAIKVETIQD
jgi:ribonucleoside-triphosphate reductase